MTVNYPRGSGKSLAPNNGEAAREDAFELSAPSAENEEDIQSATIARLQSAGYIVLQTSVRYHKQRCEECGHSARPVGGTGTTPGVPDLLVTREEWPQGVFVGIEMKDADGTLTPAQKLLLVQGRIFVARTVTVAAGIAESTSNLLSASGLDGPAMDRDAIDQARARVQKYKEAAQRRAAQKKVRR